MSAELKKEETVLMFMAAVLLQIKNKENKIITFFRLVIGD